MISKYIPLRCPYQQINMLKLPAEYITYMHEHEFCHLIYVFHGDLTLIFKKKQVSLSPGEIIFIPAGTKHNLSSRKGYIQYGINFYLSEHDRQDAMHIPFMDKVSVQFMPRLLPMLQEAYSLSERLDSIGLRLLYSYLDTVVFSFFEQLSMEKRPNHPTKLMEYIDQHLTDPQTLGSLAAAMDISVPSLERLCYQHFDMGAKALYNRRRFEHAAAMLSSGDMTIQEIAEKMGFTEPANFSNFFKRYADCSPMIYREKFLNT